MSSEKKSLNEILESIAEGSESVANAEKLISAMRGDSTNSPDNQEVRIDLDRQSRCGYPEVIYAPGKTLDALRIGFQSLLNANQNCLATRCNSEQAEMLCHRFSDTIYDDQARTVRIQVENESSGHVAVVSAGTSDLPIAKEAIETLHWMNVKTNLFVDVGVAGPQRFLSIKDQLTECDAVVVVAGMEGALPSVVGGWVSCPVIAVPTSVGYGAAFGGFAALLGMLNSCAANVAVVNIDAGFKAAYIAGMIAQKAKI